MFQPNYFRVTIKIPCKERSIKIYFITWCIRRTPGNCYRDPWGVGISCNIENSWTRSFACWRSCLSVTTCLPRQRLFLWFHIAYITIEKRVRSRFSGNMQPSKSIKLSLCFSLLWFHKRTTCHSSASFRQRYKAWRTSSYCDWHRSHLSFVITCRFTRFIFVGREFLHAFQTKFLTLLGVFICQIAYHCGFTKSELEGPGCCLWIFANKNWYPDFAAKFPS